MESLVFFSITSKLLNSNSLICDGWFEDILFVVSALACGTGVRSILQKE